MRGVFAGFGKSRAFAVLGRALVPADRVLLRISGGRVGVGAAVGLRTLLLTTIGRRSGEPRQVPLLYVARETGYVVIGSNWGGEAHPAWSANLLANPAATVALNGRTIDVSGRLLTGDERQEMWDAVAAYWPAYDRYATRAAHRDIRVFLLEPVSR
ncbi:MULTISPECIES: nitroreductase family deazaflavin-dependent oxidoreductase [unclassified Amycolatopsis]|uniref:nitroreductase family deazaflavin-dependent oxidoreductase n=1 Tax=unclassified Amycolatopsis TaxID=2618356 RepID=UPI002875B536|nr:MULTISPECIES: nitroreductase family deazaflavin-dependent oxidoreductase [unclassified Amycolatopsis]MDS0132144.1 nitroreductase family deazaflavin-dependent oxidoreductase [Amycolatopsis sp. 505]MDS0141118.1 nitroreductase family deazaflavin-dependent oxidoreductase [Amycolatopsis sp. CM201R]